MIKFLDLQKINAQYEQELKEAANSVIDSGWYLMGKELETFEQNYASFCGVKYSLGVSNGLDALRLIFKAYIEMGMMKKGDEVIVPANTYIASVLAISDNDLVPVFNSLVCANNWSFQRVKASGMVKLKLTTPLVSVLNCGKKKAVSCKFSRACTFDNSASIFACPDFVLIIITPFAALAP